MLAVDFVSELSIDHCSKLSLHEKDSIIVEDVQNEAKSHDGSIRTHASPRVVSCSKNRRYSESLLWSKK